MKLGIIGVLIFILFACDNSNLPSGSYESRFDIELWKAEASLDFDDSLLTMRQKMLGDLVENHLLLKARKEVIILLGSPADKMDPDDEGLTLSYPTGPQRDSYITIDYEWLIIEFDEQGIFKQYRVRSD